MISRLRIRSGYVPARKKRIKPRSHEDTKRFPSFENRFVSSCLRGEEFLPSLPSPKIHRPWREEIGDGAAIDVDVDAVDLDLGLWRAAAELGFAEGAEPRNRRLVFHDFLVRQPRHGGGLVPGFARVADLVDQAKTQRFVGGVDLAVGDLFDLSFGQFAIRLDDPFEAGERL